MVRTFNMVTQVPLDHELRIKLPLDVPAGLADIVMVVSMRDRTERKTLRPARKKAFGMWKDRVMAGGALEFAKRLRQTAWSRTAA